MSPLTHPSRSADRPPTVLLVTTCPWTARAVAASLAIAGLATVRAPDADIAAALYRTGACDAALIDERVERDDRQRGATACRNLLDGADAPTLPIMVLVREMLAARDQERLYAAGAWGTAAYPLGAPAWVSQLVAWTRASEAGRRRLELGLVDAPTGLYNAQGLAQRATELDAVARRTGGAIACTVFGVEAAAAVPMLGWRTGATTVGQATPVERVAAACRRVGRAADVFARVGPAEFAVIAPGADTDGAHSLVARLREALVDDGGPLVDLRVGICAVPDVHTATLSVADMLAHAASRT